MIAEAREQAPPSGAFSGHTDMVGVEHGMGTGTSVHDLGLDDPLAKCLQVFAPDHLGRA